MVVPGLNVVTDFLTETEEIDLIDTIDKTDWTLSQSGRRKQVVGLAFSSISVALLLSISIEDNYLVESFPSYFLCSFRNIFY